MLKLLSGLSLLILATVGVPGASEASGSTTACRPGDIACEAFKRASAKPQWNCPGCTPSGGEVCILIDQKDPNSELVLIATRVSGTEDQISWRKGAVVATGRHNGPMICFDAAFLDRPGKAVKLMVCNETGFAVIGAEKVQYLRTYRTSPAPMCIGGARCEKKRAGK